LIIINFKAVRVIASSAIADAGSFQMLNN